MAKKDFFISHAKEDQNWALWLFWHLEKTFGRSVFLESIEVGPGANRVLAIQKGSAEAERTIVLLSHNCRGTDITENAWTVASAGDPDSSKRKLVPIRVDDVAPEGLLAPLASIDLGDTDEQTALSKLRAFLEGSRPKSAPTFPNDKGPQFPNAEPAATTSQASGRSANSQAPRIRIKPNQHDTLAAMLDKDDQATHALELVPEDIRRRNGKMFGFVLGGYQNEWPEAALKKIGYGLAGTYDMDAHVRILQLAGARVGRPESARFLYQLLSKKLYCGDTPKEVIKQLVPREAGGRIPHIFYKVLTPQEAEDHDWLAGLLLAWGQLQNGLPKHAPSQFLILINPLPPPKTTDSDPGRNPADEDHPWLNKVKAVFSNKALHTSLMPRLVSPRRDEVYAWVSNYFPEDTADEIKDIIRENVEALFGERDEMPHGELKTKVVEILKTHL